MKDLDITTFDDFIKKGTVIVDFWAPWCGPCQILIPIFERLENEYKNKMIFAKFNVDSNKELTEKFEIRGIPCLIVFKNGKEIDRIVGSQTEDSLRSKLDLALTR